MPIYDNVCKGCGFVTEQIVPAYTEETPFCKRCGDLTERAPSAVAFHDWHQITKTTMAQPYVTSNISKDGKPIEIRSHAQLERECKKNGVVPAFGKENRIG